MNQYLSIWKWLSWKNMAILLLALSLSLDKFIVKTEQKVTYHLRLHY